jgi:hypothetical protein
MQIISSSTEIKPYKKFPVVSWSNSAGKLVYAIKKTLKSEHGKQQKIATKIKIWTAYIHIGNTICAHF